MPVLLKASRLWTECSSASFPDPTPGPGAHDPHSSENHGPAYSFGARLTEETGAPACHGLLIAIDDLLGMASTVDTVEGFYFLPQATVLDPATTACLLTLTGLRFPWRHGFWLSKVLSSVKWPFRIIRQLHFIHPVIVYR